MLIELLVVIAVIALLIGILLPVLARARAAPKRSQCLANTRQLAQAWAAYAVENKDWLVDGDIRKLTVKPAGAWAVEQGNTREALSRGHLWKYLNTVKVYRCPCDTTPNVLTYQIQWYINGQAYQLSFGNAAEHGVKRWGEIRSPERTLVFVEDYHPHEPLSGSWMLVAGRDYWTDPLAVWHDDGTVLAFADGHSVWRRWVDRDVVEKWRSADLGVRYQAKPTNRADVDYMQTVIDPRKP